ncbi:MAG: FAD-binding domain-containing protein [Puniceicoccaceae bacterium]
MKSVKEQVVGVLELESSRDAGLALLDQFLDKVPQYAAKRNYDYPGSLYVSGLSPYIRSRLIREREVIATVLREHSYETAAKFIEEVAWRTYWKGYLELHPSIWAHYREQRKQLPDTMNDLDLERWQSAIFGQTGIECFDHWVGQLRTNGWLHNHARMWFASIWIFTLRLPWELGAAFFLEHLLDGDPASNTLSWRWVAGLHTKGKRYIARASNIAKYTNGEFNPEGQLNEQPNDLVPSRTHRQIPLSNVDTLTAYAFPSLSESPAGLLVCPEELTPELGPLQDSPFASFCVFNGADRMDVIQAAPGVRAFVNGAVEDCARRTAQHWSAKVVNHSGTVSRKAGKAGSGNVGLMEDPRVHTGYVDKWVPSVVTWAQNENLKSVWMVQPPVGPWKDATANLRKALKARNIKLFEYRNQWDSVHWPHAGAGFFKFRKGLRDRIEGLAGPDRLKA